MNISAQFDHQLKKQNKEHFMNLIHVAMADGIIEPSESVMLHRFGKKMGFTEAEINHLIDSSFKSSFNPPYELNKRFEQVYEIIYLSMADGRIDGKELHLARLIALRSGFEEQEIPVLLNLMINGIELGKDEEELFDIYRILRKP